MQREIHTHMNCQVEPGFGLPVLVCERQQRATDFSKRATKMCQQNEMKTLTASTSVVFKGSLKITP